MINWSKKAVATFAALCLLANGAMAIPMPSSTPIPANKGAPTQHRVAFAGDNGMAVSWNTYEQLSNPTVWFGRSPEALNQYASSSISQTYQSSTTWSNHVKISGLAPATKYYYKVSNSADSQVYSFTTAPKKADSDPFTFAMVIDMGTMGPLGLSNVTGSGSGALRPGERNTVDALKANLDGYKFIWHPGDIAYADYWLKEQIQGYLPEVPIEKGFEVYESILNTFYEQVAGISASRPYMVGPGNHEANCDNGGTKDKKKGISYSYDICVPGQTDFIGYNSHWRMPSQESNGKENMWYSYDYGMVHFVQINTETDFGNGIIAPDEPNGSGNENAQPFGSYANEQIDWLNKDLASVDRCKTPWIIVAGHRPWYSSGKDICWQCQAAFESTLNKYNVDLAVFGHVHNYQRFTPMSNNQTDPNGLNNPESPWYIVNGAGGHYDGVDTLGKAAVGLKSGIDNVYGWSRLTVHNATHLTHEFVASSDDSVKDSATLFKKHEFNKCVAPVNPSSSSSSSSISSTSTIASSISSTSSTGKTSASSTGSYTSSGNSTATSSGSAASVSSYSYSLTKPSQATQTLTESCVSSCTSSGSIGSSKVATSSGATGSSNSASTGATGSSSSVSPIYTTTVVTVTEPCPATTISGTVITETQVVKTLTIPCSKCTQLATTSTTPPIYTTTVVTVTESCPTTTISGTVISQTQYVKTLTIPCSKCVQSSGSSSVSGSVSHGYNSTVPATSTTISPQSYTTSLVTVTESRSKTTVSGTVVTASEVVKTITVPYTHPASATTGPASKPTTSATAPSKNSTHGSTSPVVVPVSTTIVQVNSAATPIVSKMIITVAAAVAVYGLMLV